MPPPVQSMGPETLCFRVVRPPVRKYVLAEAFTARLAVNL